MARAAPSGVTEEYARTHLQPWGIRFAAAPPHPSTEAPKVVSSSPELVAICSRQVVATGERPKPVWGGGEAMPDLCVSRSAACL